ncbi:MAG TPA: FecR domain-containing protein [Terriglobales bacterium]|nr:FecR domain-containing protein [Terriglobales bacterium]
MSEQDHIPRIQVGWKTATYRSVLGTILLAVGILIGASYIVFPEPTKKAASTLLELAERIGANTATKQKDSNAQQASFTLIDGTVKVKKANSNAWVNADYQLPLEKGDVVQTGSEGMAKVVFPDGTSYNVKQDSLIVVEENSANDAQQTNVAVQLTTGTVDLSTGTYTQGSKSQVIVAGATASFSRDSSAMVHNDPKSDDHEILVKRGSGQVIRGKETMPLGEYEKVTFTSEETRMTKVKEIAPPTLIGPANMAPLFVDDPSLPIPFTWSPVPNTAEYRIRVSRNPYFSSTVEDRKVTTTATNIAGLAEGAYYWEVQSIDKAGRQSVESEKNRFTIIRKGPENASIALELLPFVQHGHVLEIKGKTEPTARVMVNGQEVPVIAGDGGFQFFTAPLPSGENIITVTAQNSKGGVRTQQEKVVIQ